MSKLRSTITVLSLAIALSALTGCVGPIWSTHVIGGAESAIEAAEKADAERLAPYEYFRAQELLRKAREEWGYSDFDKSRRYAQEAEDFAKKAREKAETDPWKGSPADGAPTEPAAPATTP